MLHVLFFVLSVLFGPNTPSNSATAFIKEKNSSDTIYWNSNRKLVWSDFRGTPGRGTSTVALTSSGIGMSYRKGVNNTIQIDVSCVFYCRTSWVKEEGRNDTVLLHEQLHFDITELYARKLRKAIMQLSERQKDWTTVKRVYDDLNRQCSLRQELYDSDTHHSIIYERQLRWVAMINDELLLHKDYASDRGR